MHVQELYNKLYVHLATEMHTALNQLIHQTAAKAHHRAGPHKPHAAKGGSKGSEGPSKHQLAVLKGLADEAELTADLTAAERYHQERVLAPANAQVSWASFPLSDLHSPRALLSTRMACDSPLTSQCLAVMYARAVPSQQHCHGCLLILVLPL